MTNNINGKVYIGQTKQSLVLRWCAHRNQTGCSALRRAIDKYGRENFTIEVIDGANSPGELNYLEKKHIIENNCIVPNGYNILSGGTSTYRLNPDSPKRKKAQNSSPRSEEWKNKISASCSNRKFSEEHREKLRQAKLGKPSNSRPENRKKK